MFKVGLQKAGINPSFTLYHYKCCAVIGAPASEILTLTLMNLSPDALTSPKSCGYYLYRGAFHSRGAYYDKQWP